VTPKEKGALILALLKRIEGLEARLGGPPKTPDNLAFRRHAGRNAHGRRARRNRGGSAMAPSRCGSWTSPKTGAAANFLIP